MFTFAWKAFFLESYFRGGFRREDGTWEYSLQMCYDEYILQLLNENMSLAKLFTHSLHCATFQTGR